MAGTFIINAKTGQRIRRENFITVLEWDNGETTKVREAVGTRVEDSSIEYNADIEQKRDILGNNYTDVNGTLPQQTLDPGDLVGGSKLAEYLTMAGLTNDIDKYNNVFTVYLICKFMESDGTFFAIKHDDCSVIPSSFGGSDYLQMPYDIYFSNKITKGTVDKMGNDFTFTPAA